MINAIRRWKIQIKLDKLTFLSKSYISLFLDVPLHLNDRFAIGVLLPFDLNAIGKTTMDALKCMHFIKSWSKKIKSNNRALNK